MPVKRINNLVFTVIGGCLAWGICFGADSYELVSETEYARSVEADTGDDELIDRAPDPMAPSIEVKRPGEGSDYRAPIDIEVEFVPKGGANIDLDSLKITYGALGINVTERVTENARVTPEGILSEGAALPAGSHKLTIYISDSDGREGKRRFKFRIIE